MKKTIYILLLTVAASLTISSCTEEQVEPQNTTTGVGGGGVSEGK
jgi:hypothetical protein